MRWVIGTDEAGYGPNLGPLAVSATCWKLPDGVEPDGMAEALAPVVSAKPTKDTVAIADSKKLHKPGSVKHLERGVLAALEALGGLETPLDDERLMVLLCGEESLEERREFPCFAPAEPLPQEEELATCRAFGERLREQGRVSGVTLCGIRSELVFPRRFNDGVERLDSKGAFLSDTTLQLAFRFWTRILNELENQPEGTAPAEVFLLCDKHGGRDRYLPTLWDNFPGLTFCVNCEGREKSEYVYFGERVTLHVLFRAKGEASLAVALASMTSKYLRELAMGRWNRWWKQVLPDIAPTAGYPVDALRFRSEIEAEVAKRGIDWHAIWRNR